MITACGPSAPDKNYKLGGDFTLTDTSGEKFSLKDLRGKLVFLYFGYLNCPDACPFTMSKLSSVYSQFSDEEKDQLATVFVSVDPDRDTPEKMKKYLSNFPVNPVGLTGTEKAIDKAAQKYGIFYKKVDSGSAAGYTVDHTTYTFLIDQKGKLRYMFRHKDPVDKMVEITRLLLEE